MKDSCMIANIPNSKETLIMFMSNNPTIEYIQYIYEFSLNNYEIKKLFIENLREIIAIIIFKNKDYNIHISRIFNASLIYLTNNDGGFQYLKDVIDFLSNESIETINAELQQLHINNVKKLFNAGDEDKYYPFDKASVLFSPVEIRNYYMCRIYYKYNHKDALQTAGLLDNDQFIIFSIIKGTIKRNNMGNVSPDEIIYASIFLNKEKSLQMFMMMHRFNLTLNEASVFLTYTDYNEKKINVMKKLLGYNIDTYFAAQAAIKFNTVEQINKMIEVKLKGVNDRDSFSFSFWEIKHQDVFIRLLDYMEPLNAFDIARDYKLIEEIDLYIKLINNNISSDFIQEIVQINNIEMYMEHLHKIVYLAEKGVDEKMMNEVCGVFFDPRNNYKNTPKEELYKMIDESKNVAETLKQHFQSK
jgi:hypothetical protein